MTLESHLVVSAGKEGTESDFRVHGGRELSHRVERQEPSKALEHVWITFWKKTELDERK